MTVSSILIARNQNVNVSKVTTALKYVLVTRTVTSCLSLLGIMVGIRTLPLTIFMLIINTNSFTTGLLQWLHLKKPVHAYEIAAMFGCYLGIVLIVYGSGEKETNSVGSTYTLLVGYIASVIASITISMSAIAIHQMRELHFAVIQFWQSLGNCACFLVYYAYQLYSEERYPLEPPANYSDYQWYYCEIILAAASSVMANSLMTICNKNEKPATVTVVSQVAIGFSFLSDTIFFGTMFNGV